MAAGRYHPETVAYLKLVEEESLCSDLREYTPDLARSERTGVTSFSQSDKPFEGTTNDIIITSGYYPDGIPATVYVPNRVPEDPAILVYFHGGGMVIGSRASVDATCRRLAMDSPCIVVNVEYRLAPEHKFPASSEDAESAVNWVIRNKVTVGGTTRSPVGVGGDSAGGTISATAAHQVTGLAFQILVYPRVNYKPGPLRKSAKDYEDGPILSKEVVAWYHGHFLRGPSDGKDLRLNPYSRENFARLPPALLVVAECDPLRDDSYDYQVKMKEAGLKAELFQVNGACHGFFTKPGVFKECCAAAYKRVTEFIREVAYTQ